MSKKTDKQLRLRRLTEREIDPNDLAQVVGGVNSVKRQGHTRYCTLTDPEV